MSSYFGLCLISPRNVGSEEGKSGSWWLGYTSGKRAGVHRPSGESRGLESAGLGGQPSSKISDAMPVSPSVAWG